MRQLIAAVVLLAAMTPAFAQSAGTLSYGQDARTEASDDDVRVARRAYRAACEQHQNTGYCECMTGGMAQALAPGDLRTATLLLASNLTGAAAPAGLDATSVAAAQAATAQFEPSCSAFRTAGGQSTHVTCAMAKLFLPRLEDEAGLLQRIAGG